MCKVTCADIERSGMDLKQKMVIDQANQTTHQ